MLKFWDESHWLPGGIRWQDLQSNATHRFPSASELPKTIYLGLSMFVFRILVEAFVYLPIGVHFGWINAKKTELPRLIFAHLTGGFAGRGKFKRVAETAWRFTFYSGIWLFGLVVLWNEPQLADVRECWRNWPYHTISNGVWWYYQMETAFYWVLFFSTFFIDIRRSDFWQMMTHHGVTIVLLSISWSINMVRVGTLVLFSHDAGDVLIELSKLFRYARWQKPLTILFCIFMCVWIGTRLIYYPFWVIWSIVVDAPAFIQSDYRWEKIFQSPIVPRILMVLLCSLVALHIFWTWILIRVALQSLNKGDIDDIREDSDAEEQEASLEKKMD